MFIESAGLLQEQDQIIHTSYMPFYFLFIYGWD